MKTKRINLLTIIAVIAMMSIPLTEVMAQRPGRGYCWNDGPGMGRGMQRQEGRNMAERIPGLTDEQKTGIENLRTAHFRKAELIRAEIGEKQARLNTLRLAEKQDEKAIDKTIDEVSKLRGDLMKERESHRREVKALLNDEQKVWFDSNCGQGYGRGFGGPGMGNRGYGMRGGRYCRR